MGDFVEYKSEGVWLHFLRKKDGQAAQCKLCKTKLKTVTKGLHEHLKRVHDITVLKQKLADEESHSPSTPKHAAGSSILSYVVQQNDNTLSATLAHMTARDGLPFRDIARLTKRSYCNGFRQLATF